MADRPFLAYIPHIPPHLIVARGVDSVALEYDRKTQVTTSFAPPVDQLTAQGRAGFRYSIAYVSVQELAEPCYRSLPA